MLTEQARHIAYLIGEAEAREATLVEPTQQAVDNWQAEMAAMAMATKEFFEACTPGYYNNEGDLSGNSGLRSTAYGGGSEAFFAIIRAWREAGTLAGVELR
jgi:cyclohexanone monooxygenase